MRKLRLLPAVLALLLALETAPEALAAEGSSAAAAADRCAAYLLSAADAPQVGSVGGEWTVIALARSGVEVPEHYWENYLAAVDAHTAASGGVLHQRKYTEYSRVALALTAIGADPADVGGYDLLSPLGDFDGTIRQGVNGAVWALIALDSAGYDVPAAPPGQTQATRQGYVDAILARQLPEGGWSLAGAEADPDLTAMALQALAPYRRQPEVQDAVDWGVNCLSRLQNSDGGYASQGIANAESTAQVVTALCTLGIPLEDPRFMKNGNTVLDALLGYQQPDGGFRHTVNGSGSDTMATEQALCALAAVARAETGAPGLYQMTDAGGSAGGTSWRQAAAIGCTLAKSVMLAVTR